MALVCDRWRRKSSRNEVANITLSTRPHARDAPRRGIETSHTAMMPIAASVPQWLLTKSVAFCERYSSHFIRRGYPRDPRPASGIGWMLTDEARSLLMTIAM